MTISDHKPKKVVLDLRRRKKWRREYVRRRTPVIRWERLKEEEGGEEVCKCCGEEDG